MPRGGWRPRAALDPANSYRIRRQLSASLQKIDRQNPPIGVVEGTIRAFSADSAHQVLIHIGTGGSVFLRYMELAPSHPDFVKVAGVPPRDGAR